jgi:hypothetical protein
MSQNVFKNVLKKIKSGKKGTQNCRRTIVKIYIFESQFKCQSRVNKFDILYNIINHIVKRRILNCIKII